ncbi:hypothetical protein MHYP_G00319730 [Metynnis hypsauchen]
MLILLDVCGGHYESAVLLLLRYQTDRQHRRNQGRSVVKRQMRPKPQSGGPGDGNEGANRAHGEETNSILLAAQMGPIDLLQGNGGSLCSSTALPASSLTSLLFAIRCKHTKSHGNSKSMTTHPRAVSQLN